MDRSSFMVSMPPRSAFPTALKRHELSSGMIRSTKVAPRSGIAISGGSAPTSRFFLRLSPKGFDNFGAWVFGFDSSGGGAVPNPSKENPPEGLAGGGLCCSPPRNEGFTSVEDLSVWGPEIPSDFESFEPRRLLPSFLLTISCSPLRLIPISETLVDDSSY